MIIIGAGMAGLLAGNMLQRHDPSIIEKEETLPNNHSAVLRFRSSIVGDTLGIPFRRVNMIKTAIPWRNPVADALNYSYKNTGVRRSDRSITSGLVSEIRFIAPPDLIQLMYAGVRQNVSFKTNFQMRVGTEPIISTIPMPILMKMLGYKSDLKFSWSSGGTFKARIKNCDAYVSLLVPDPEYNFTRLSITGDELFIEIHNSVGVVYDEAIAAQAASLLGIPVHQFYDLKIKEQKFSKINPIDDNERKKFMLWATTKHNIYSLGRFATWRPGLLLDDLVNDVRLIDRWIRQGNSYEAARAT